MMFLFENTLTPYIYSVFFTLISLAQSSQSWQLLSYEQTLHTDRHTLAPIWAASPMSNHTRTASGCTTSTASGRLMGAPSSPAGTPHAQNSAPTVPAGHPRPPGCAPEYTYKFRLTFTIPMGNRAAVALFWSRFVQNLNSL